jgi:capsular exopolysaccharide synthesis family protein
MSKYRAAVKRAEDVIGVFGIPLRTGDAGGLSSPDDPDIMTPVRLTVAPSAVHLEAPSLPEKGQRIASYPKVGVPAWTLDSQPSRAGEQYRIIRTKVSKHPKQPRIVLISSPASGDGKTVSAMNLAAIFALKNEGKVLLVEADMRRSALCKLIAIEGTPGLSDVIGGYCSFSSALVCIENAPNLYILPAGTPETNPAELLDSENWRALHRRLQEEFEFVIVDAPPVAAVADYELLEAACDGVILIVRPDHTPRKLLDKTIEAVRKDKLIGVVLNDVPEWFLWKHQHYSQYYY